MTGGPTIFVLCCLYEAWARQRYLVNGRPSSQVSTVTTALRWMRERHGPRPAVEFSPRDIAELQTEMIRSGLARTTINAYIGAIKAMFSWAATAEQSLVDPSTAAAVLIARGLRKGRTSAREAPRVRPVEDAALNFTLPFLHPTIADMVVVQRLTGMRPGELCAMRWNEIDRSGPAWVYAPTHHKTAHYGIQRLIGIGPRARQVLENHYHPSSAAYVFQRPRIHGSRRSPNDIRALGRPISEHWYQRCIQRACDRAGTARWNARQLRKNWAVEVARTLGPEAARQGLGHTTYDTTALYVELSRDAVIDAAMRVG